MILTQKSHYEKSPSKKPNPNLTTPGQLPTLLDGHWTPKYSAYYCLSVALIEEITLDALEDEFQ